MKNDVDYFVQQSGIDNTRLLTVKNGDAWAVCCPITVRGLNGPKMISGAYR